MASNSRRQNDSDHSPHFFKIVLPRTLRKQKLEIPKKFVSKHGLEALLNDQTCLTVAGGAEWKVGLTKSNGRIWFQNGWQEFVKFYSVRFGYFLVFRYERQSSSFHVVIFDHSASEIQYPAKKNVLLDEAEIKVEMATEYPKDFPVGGGGSGGVQTEKGENGRMKPPPPTASQRAIAMEKATAFQSRTRNPSFMCKIWPSHLRPRKCLNIPKSFAEKHVKKPTIIVLQVSNGGRMWSVRCYVCRRSSAFRTQMSGGWSMFAGDNNLQVGDFCVFEMIKKSTTSISLEVSIFRNS